MTIAAPTALTEYLDAHRRKDRLRFVACGSVDDGKSTLIGRLLYESQMVFDDQLEALAADSIRSGTQNGDLDLALLLDGLRAEREQGITIDVAHRYFSTAASARSSSSTRPATSSTRATWSRAPRPPTPR